MKIWEHFPGHQFQRPAHVRHRHAAEVDHADYMGDAGLCVFAKNFAGIVGIGKERELVFFDGIKIRYPRSRPPIFF